MSYDAEDAPVKTDLEGKKHAFALACYRKSGGETLPTLECVCGMWWSGDTWEDTGSFLDDHLEDVADGPA